MPMDSGDPIALEMFKGDPIPLGNEYDQFVEGNGDIESTNEVEKKEESKEWSQEFLSTYI